MNEDMLNSSIRKFLKEVGVTSQREIERAIRAAIDNGALKGNEKLPAVMVLKIQPLNLTHEIDGTIHLE